MQRVHDRVKETSTYTGAGGVLTLLGAATQFASFGSRFAIGEPIYVCVAGQTGTEWEVGRWHLSGLTTLVRDEVLESSNISGNPNVGGITFGPVNFGAGTKDVFCTIPAERVEEIYTKGQANALAMGLPMV